MRGTVGRTQLELLVLARKDAIIMIVIKTMRLLGRKPWRRLSTDVRALQGDFPLKKNRWKIWPGWQQPSRITQLPFIQVINANQEKAVKSDQCGMNWRSEKGKRKKKNRQKKKGGGDSTRKTGEDDGIKEKLVLINNVDRIYIL
jgi:hypothetical protein